MIYIRRRYIPKNYPLVILYLQPLLISFAVIVQLANPGWLMIYPAYMLCMVLAFLFFQNVRVRSERAQLQQLVDMIEHFACGLAICRVQKNGQHDIEYISTGLYDIFEMEPAFLRSRMQVDLFIGVYAADLGMVSKHLTNMLEKCEKQDFIYRFVNADGRLKWINVQSESVLNDDGSVTVYVTYTDLTVQQEAISKYEHALEREHGYIKEKGLLAYASFDLTSNVTLQYCYANGIEVPVGDRTSFERLHENADKLIDFEERRLYEIVNNKQYLLDKFAAGETEFRQDYRRLLANGLVTWVRNVMRLLRDPRTGDILLFEYWYDIEDEKMQELMYRSIATDNYDIVARIDARTHHFKALVRDNLAYHMPPQSGDNADEVTYAMYSEHVLAEDKEKVIQYSLIDTMRKHLEKTGRFVFTYRLQMPDGQLRIKKITQYYIDREREIIALLREDISELISAEADKNEILSEALAEANQASQAKSQFLSRVSHELRTPLNAIIGFMELVKEANPDEMATYLSNSEIAARQLLSIINDVLDFSSIEAGKMKVSHVPFDFARLIKSITKLYKQLFKQKGIEFEVILCNQIDHYLLGDQLRVNQILLNILNNALKFTDSGKVSLSIDGVEREAGTLMVKFVIADTGCGMSEQMCERLFEPFEQESAVTAQRYGGNGLGLSIVHNLVELMDGSISVSSKLGEGSTFTVVLPFLRTSPVENAFNGADNKALHFAAITNGRIASETEQNSSFDLQNMRILLAEDNAMNRMVAVNMIYKRFGAQCECANDGKIAVDMFLKAPAGYYDVILMDVQMPNMNGYEATKAIRSSAHPDAHSVQIIAVTANAFSEDVVKSLANGMNAHISKPIEAEVLGEELMRAYQARKNS